MNKKQMSEQDIRTKYITPAILAAGWDRDLQIREEVSFTKGKITVRRKIVKRGEQKRADYILYWKPNIPLEMSRNVQSGNTQNLKSMVIQRSFPKWSVAERRKTAAASDQAAVCVCAHSRYFAGGSPSGLRV